MLVGTASALGIGVDDKEIAQRIEKQKADYQNRLAELEALKKQKVFPFDEKMILAYFEVISATSNIAMSYEETKDFGSARTWYQTGLKFNEECNEPLVRAKQISPFARHLGIANTSLELREYWEAEHHSLRAMDTALPIDLKVHRAYMVNAQANLILGDFKTAENTLKTGQSVVESSQTVSSVERANFHRISAAMEYLKGNLAQAKVHWQKAAGIDGRFGDIDLFDPVQAPMNAAIYANPKSGTARLARGRYLVYRSEQLATKQQSFGAAPLHQGGVVNVVRINSPETGDLEQDAVRDLSAGLEADESNAALYLHRAMAMSAFNGRTGLKRKYPVKSITDDITNAMLYVKSDGDTLAGIGRYLISQKYKPETAMPFFARALVQPKDVPDSKGVSELRQRLFDQLPSKTWTAAPAILPKTAVAWKDRGNQAFAEGAWREALTCFTKATALDPKFADAIHNRGKVFESVGCLDLTLDEFTKAIKLDPKHRLAFLSRAVVLASLGKLEEALTDLTVAESVATTPAHKARVHLIRSNVYANQYKATLALESAEHALKLDPENAKAKEARAVALLYSGKGDEAAQIMNVSSPSLAQRMLRALALKVSGGSDFDGVWAGLVKDATRADLLWMQKFAIEWFNSPAAPARNSKELSGLRDFYQAVRSALNRSG